MKRFIIFAALLFAGAAFADTATLANGQQANLTGTNSATIAPNAVGVSFNSSAPAVTSTTLDGFTRFETNQAATAPTIVGGTAPAGNGGCPAVDGITGSVAFAQLGKTTARELEGCMANWLAEAFGRLTTTAGGAWTTASRMKLEAWCDFAQYRRIIERTQTYECAVTREERAQAALQGQVPTDPYIAARLAGK